jgi:hypothetical protein
VEPLFDSSAASRRKLEQDDTWRRASTLSFAADLAMLRFNDVAGKRKSRVANGCDSGHLL